jgi:uncharacterized membrane protein YdbT with pleckstrin-like domain
MATAAGQVPAAGAAPARAAADAVPPADQSNYVLSSPPDETPEKILWDEYPSMRTAIPGIVIAILVGGAIIVALQFFPIIGNRIVQLVIMAIVALLVIAEILRHYIRLHSIKYRMSNQRIFVTYGLVNKRTDEVELEKYKDIFVNQDFWDHIVGCGDIEVVTSDVTNPTIRIIDVADPIGKKESIRTAARERKSVLGITRREEL